MSGLDRQIELANTRIERWKNRKSPVHGRFVRLGAAEDPLALVRCGLHCTACAFNVGGVFDLSLYDTVEECFDDLVEQLSAKGCPHVAAVS